MNAVPDIFKAYDIRGTIPDQLDAAAATQVGRAFAALVKPKTVVVGRDMRTSGGEMRQALLEGLTKSGVNVIDVGLVATDEFYFACGSKKLPGLMVTASHNPPNYNGFKMVKKMPFFVSGQELKSFVLDQAYEDAAKSGTVTEESVADDFIAKMLSLVDASRLKPLKVVVDSGNGMAGPIWQRLAEKLPITMIPMFAELDGSFPNRGPDPLQLENQEKLRAMVAAEKADLGFIFDTDGDRFFLVDDQARSVPGDFVVALLAKQELQTHPGANVIYDIRASHAVPDLVKEAGGRPLVNPVGHAKIKPRMMAEDADFGGEISGHIYYKDFFFADSGTLPALKVLELVSRAGQPLSALLTPIEDKYHVSGEINSTVKDIKNVFTKVKKRYSDGRVEEIDGLSVTYPDWHFNVRPSNTEPLVRLNLEADTAEKMAAKRDEVLAIIRS